VSPSLAGEWLRLGLNRRSEEKEKEKEKKNENEKHGWVDSNGRN
jgi:hypothetical protein